MTTTIQPISYKVSLLLILISLLLAACQGGPSSGSADDANADIPVVDIDVNVVADGRLVPRDSVHLAFVVGGRVAEVLIDEGDTVQAGDVIARLGDREQLEANIAAAELELSLVEQDLLTIELDVHNAELELLTAQQALDELYDNWPDEAIAAQQALNEARQAVHDTKQNFDYVTGTAPQFDIDSAWSQVVLAEKELEDAEEKFEEYANKPDDNLTRANFQSKLALAQKEYDAAVRKYNALKDPTNDFDISQAEASYNIEQARLEQVQDDYAELAEGPDPDDVDVTKARIAASESRLATANGRRDSVEDRLSAAKASIKAAQAALDNLDLVASIDGTVVELDLIVAEQVAAGVNVVLIADFSQWYVETDNLTEIEVVDVAIDQQVIVIFDALTEVELTGRVDSISDVFEEKRGDITYTTRILLNDTHPLLRWGMTGVVTFEDE
jgi:multidrug resistance efflux pump